MIAAKPPQLRLRQPLKLIVKRLPDVKERKKIGIRMRKTSVRGIGSLLFIHRPVARVLDAQAGGDDEDFAQRFFRARLQDHAPDGWVDWQPREFAPDGRQRSHEIAGFFRGQRADFLEQHVARANRLRRRWVDKGKALDVAEPKGL